MKFDKAKSVVSGIYSTATNAKTKVPWKRGLRPSGFPYCGLRDLWDLLNGGRQVEKGFGLDYYGGVGTAAHRAFQKYMGLSGYVVGDWKCTCGKKKKWSTESTCVCGLEMEYCEVGVVNGSIRGLIDCILLIDDKYYVLDYKTSSTSKLMEHRLKGNVYPVSSNVHQILSYCANLERQYGVQISGWFLMYIARDNPRDFVVEGDTFDSRERLKQKQTMLRYNEQYSLVTKLSKSKFNVKTNEDYIKVVEKKPCCSFEEFRSTFGAFDDCPLGVSNACFNRKRLDRLVEESI